MSQVKATITHIDSIDNLNIVKFDFLGHSLTMMSLGLNDDICIGKEVLLSVKPTHIALGKTFSGLMSYSNQIEVKIASCTHGKLLSSITLLVEDVLFESIITLESALTMHLNVDDNVTMMIQASDLSIVEVL